MNINRAESRGRRAEGGEQRAESVERRAWSGEQRVWSVKRGVESMERRALGQRDLSGWRPRRGQILITPGKTRGKNELQKCNPGGVECRYK